MSTALWDEKFSSHDLSYIEIFEKNVKAGKGDSVEVYEAHINMAKSILNDILSRLKPKNIIAFGSSLVVNFLEEVQKNTTINIYFSGDKQIASVADIGISEMEFAIAESGSLVELSDSIWKRFVSAMPSIHIALVKADRIVKNFESAFEILEKNMLHSNHISFITGPSITADIERVLTIGVHGPSKLIVFFVREKDNERQSI